jgi:putative addiction module antidote
MQHVKITAIGNSAGIILPKDVLARLGVERGDTITLVEEPGALRIVRADDAYNQAVDAGRECFDRYPQTMADLAR